MHTLLFVAQTPWKGEFQRPAVQLLIELAPRHRVVYLDYQYTLKDVWMHIRSGIDVPLRKVFGLENRLEKLSFDNGSTGYRWTPPVTLPINWMPARWHDYWLKINARRLIKAWKPVAKKMGITAPIVVNAFHPVYGWALMGQLDEKRNIYYCFDEITAEPWMAKHGARLEPPYLAKVDAVVSTSETLRRAKGKVNPRSYAVKNGANVELFSRANQIRTTAPNDQKIVGYLGTADNRVDADIVEYCVRTLPDVRFQFIGPVNHPELRQRLASYPNVDFLGSHDPEALPGLMAKMSVGMIPFVRNDHTYTIYPLKINEYLAAGMGVVSTEFSIMDDFKSVIHLANTPQAFADALRNALTQDTPEKLAQRLAVVANNSWTKRAEEFESVLEEVLNEPMAS